MADRIFPYGEAPDDAEFVLTEPNQDLPNAKELIAGTGISITVGADTVTISGDGSSAQTYITANDETSTLPNSFQVVEGSNVTLDYVGSQLIISASVSGAGGGTVTIVNSGNANPLFTTNVTTATTTPTIAYTLSSAASGTFFGGRASGAAGEPDYRGILGTDLSGALEAGTYITLTPDVAPGSRLTINTVGLQPLSSTLNALSTSLSGAGYITQTGPDSFAERTFQDSTNITWTNPAGIAGNSSANVTSNVYTKNDSSLLNHLASTAPSLGQVPMGASDGSYILTKPNAGTGIQMDFANGVFTVSATGATGNPGTLTNFTAGQANPIFGTSVANPTTAPALSFNITSNVLTDLATSTSTGIVVQSDSVGHHVYRQIDGTTGEINVTNPSGVGANPTLSLDSSVYTNRDSSVLNALATGLAGTGFVSQNGAAFYDRTLTGTTNRVTVTNPTGAAGDPVFDVGTDVLVVGDVTALPGIQIVNGSGVIQVGASGALGGTVTEVESADLAPIFVTNVTNSTSTPVINYTLSQVASGGVLVGPITGADDEPTYRRLLGEDIFDAVVSGANVTIDLVDNQLIISSTASGGGGGSVTEVSAQNLPPLFTTNVDTATTTPDIQFTLSNVASGTFFAGPLNGSPDEPDYRTIEGTDLLVALEAGANITLSLNGNNLVIAVAGQLNASLIADGSVSDTEFQYLNGVTSGIQGQLDGKQDEDTVLTSLTAVPGDGEIPIGDSGVYTPALPLGGPGIQLDTGAGFLTISSSGALGGTLTDLDVGHIIPLWTTNVSNPTTTPVVSYTLNDLASGNVLIGPVTGVDDSPTLRRLLGHDITDAVEAGSNITFSMVGDQIVISSTASGGGGGSVTEVFSGDLPPLFTTVVNSSTTTPDIQYTLANAASGIFLAGSASGADAPWAGRGILGTDLTGALQAGANITISQSTPPGSRLIIAIAGQLDATLIADGSVTNTEFQYLGNVTSDIQTQFSNKQPLDATLTALAAYDTNGLITQTSTNTFTGRTLTGTAGEINVSNGNGVSGNPTVSLDASVYTDRDSSVLNALATGVNGTGFLAQNGASFVDRTLTGTTNRITVSNGTGASGDPVFDLGSDAYTISSSNVLNDLASSTSTGVMVQTDSVGHHAYRTLTGTANEISISNGNGVSGNPTFSLPTGIDVTKLADGSVDNTEFQYLDGVTSDIQTQLDGKLVSAGDLAPIFTTSEAAGNISFTLSNTASANFLRGPASGSSGPWTAGGILGTDLTGALEAGSNVTITQAAEPGSRLIISSTGGSGYDTVEEEGTPLTQRSTINFVGSGITAADVSSKTQVSLDSTLESLAAYNTNGLLTQTAADTFTGRTITGTTNVITVTNGNGVSGNPTLTVGSLVVRTDQANTYSSGAQSFASVTTTLGAVTLSGTITPSAANTYDIGTANVGIRDIYLGGTSNFTTRITITTPSADRTFKIPNADSVAVVGDAGASNNFLTAISPTTGVISKAQPAFSNLSGAATNSQLPTVDVGHGGLGITSTPTNGQIPIGNGTNYVAAAITAGNGVTVTNGSGSITIASKAPVAVRKNADTSRTNDTLTADPDLSIPVGANESWTFIVDFVVLTTNNAPDVKFCLTGPSGATVTWNAYATNVTDGVITYIAATAGGTPVAIDMSSNKPQLVHITGTVSGTYSAGNVTLDWAQNVTNASPTVLKAASSMVGYPS